MATPQKPLWKHRAPEFSQVDVFRRQMNLKYGLSLKTYDDLHRWSVDELETFSAEVWRYCGIVYSKPPTATAIGLESMWPRPQWFPGARLNYAENMLATGLAVHPDAIAVSACREGGTEWRHLSWVQLRAEVERYVSAFKQAGVGKGDRVAAVMTNSPEVLLVLLASAAVGAIFSSTAPDMGQKGITERYLQIKPKILFVDSEVLYGGRSQDLRGKVGSVVRSLQSASSDLEKVVVTKGRLWQGKNLVSLDTFLQAPRQELVYEQVEFDYPVYILYSSGTTGPPKCICHAGGAALLQQKKDLMLIKDMGPNSVYYQYTTTGWMMWNYLMAGLSTGARIVMYDGSPSHPSPEYQVQLLSEQGVTEWGTSPKFLAALKQHGLRTMPNLDNLYLTLVTGSPLSVELSEWFYQKFPRHVATFSSSGGTDLVSAIVNGSMMRPFYAGELATKCLGMAVEVWDLDGKNIEETGDKGDLVITKPFFSMPVTFWGKDGMEKYRKAYFDQFPGIWCHGDFISKNPSTQGFIIHGRSDGVLNPGGIRFGTAELYGIVDKFPDVVDCIAVGQRRDHDTDERVLLFLKLAQRPLTKDLETRIKTAIKTELSARHVPSYILEVADIPYTANGKKIENVVKDIVSGRVPKIGGTAVNPECLDEYKTFADLEPAPPVKAKL
ncbi:hypothetical protein RBB50_000905 [Rhinocladiella similis]